MAASTVSRQPSHISPIRWESKKCFSSANEMSEGTSFFPVWIFRQPQPVTVLITARVSFALASWVWESTSSTLRLQTSTSETVF